MLNKNNIEEIFKSGLENLESPVPTDVWAGIEANLPTTGASATTGIAKSLLTKVAIGVVSVGAISYGIYHFTNSTTNTENITEVSPVNSENNLNITEESNSNENNIQPDNSENLSIANESIEKTEETENSSEAKIYPKNHINRPNTYIPTSTDNKTINTNSGEKNSTANKNVNENEVENSSNPNPEKTVENETPLAVEIIANETEGKIPFNVSLNLDKEVNQVVWSLPNGKQINATELNYTFEKLGQHTVKVKATDIRGKTATSEITVDVLPNSKIILPKDVNGTRLFRANGTNKFQVEFENIATLEGYVWDKSGNEVFKFNTIEDAKWDGKDMVGNICEPGLYFVLIKATDINGYPTKTERFSIQLIK